MKKLCYICEATQGGVRKHLRDLFRVFTRPEEGFEVHAILGDRGEPGFHEELKQFPVLKFRFVPDLKRALRPGQDWRAYKEIKELLRDIAPDVVHTHSAKAGYLGRTAAHNLGITNVLHTAHVFPFQWAHGLAGRIYLALEKQAARYTRTLICVGESQRADALARNLADAEKLVVIRNGLTLPNIEPRSREIPLGASGVRRLSTREMLGIPSESLAVGMVARMAPQKGVGAFVQAAAEVIQKRPGTVFCMVGGGPLEPEVRERMARLKLTEQNLRLLGHREDAEKLYAAFDVLVLSSLYEGLPYVLLEAMAWGVPVVATDVLGSRDVVQDGETGFLARVNDPADIAAKTLTLLEDTNLRERFGAAARKRVTEQFSYDAFIQGHRKLYNRE